MIISESESLRSGTPVKSDISGTGSVSGYGTGPDSGSDKTPPYLPPPPPPPCFATMSNQGICNPMEGHVTYAQLTLPNNSSRCGVGQRYPSNGDKVIYSQIDMTRKAAAKKGHHLSSSTMNPYMAEDPSSWAPLLGTRNQPESSL
jgi:hypothetical protein